MNILGLFAHLPLATVLALIVSVVIPAVSALLVQQHWDTSITGALTLLLSTATGFLTEWAHAGPGFAWKGALGTALLSWIVALASQRGLLSGTDLEAALRAFGSPKRATITSSGAYDVSTLPPAADSIDDYNPEHAATDTASVADSIDEPATTAA